MPTLAVVGSADRALTGVNALKAVWPSLKVVVLQDAVHSSANERGAPRRPEFVGAIWEFVPAHRGGSSNERHFQANCRLKPVRSSRKEEDTVTVTKDRPILVLTVSLPKRR